MSEKPLSPPAWFPPWWIGAAFLGAWVASFFIGLILGMNPEIVLFLTVYTWQAPAVGGVLLAMYFWQRRAQGQREAMARALGLEYRQRVYPADIEPYRELTLFALTENCRRWAGYHYQGALDGEAVEVFDYGFVGKFRTIEDRTVTWPGRQTIFLLPGAERLPDFLLSPADSDWGDLIAARVWSLEAGDAVLEVELDDDSLATLRGRDRRAIKALFRSDRLEEMGLAPGWTIECHGGRLMLYRDRKVIGPEELGRYLLHVVRVAAVLKATALPGDAEALGEQGASPDRHVRPDFGEPD